MTRRLALRLAGLGARLWGGIRRRRGQEAGFVPVLCYHRVLSGLVEDPEEPLYTLLPEQFEAQMALLAREGFRSLSLPEFIAAARGLGPLPPRAVLLTFDDGYADFYQVAWPLARKYGMTLTLFLTTGFVGRPEMLFMARHGYRFGLPEEAGGEIPAPWQAHARRFPELWRPLTWGEVRELHAAGVGLGLHGHTHADLGRLPAAAALAEVETGIRLLATGIGVRPECVALPYGGYASVPRAALPSLRERGIRYLFTTIYGRPRLPGSPFLIPRLLVVQQDSLADFRRKLTGAYDFLGRLQGWKYRLRLLASPILGMRGHRQT
ncbi:MAG: polysaccharide deacetylase family protein [Syntrophobacterales bacterium]|nr:polysaccharide deacetylase family protein [Syntrophobacterales bacterium]